MLVSCIVLDLTIMELLQKQSIYSRKLQTNAVFWSLIELLTIYISRILLFEECVTLHRMWKQRQMERSGRDDDYQIQ